MRDPPETDSQALAAELGLKGPAKEYGPLYCLMGRSPKRAASARHRRRHRTQEGGCFQGGLAGRKEVVEFQGLREVIKGGEKDPGS